MLLDALIAVLKEVKDEFGVDSIAVSFPSIEEGEMLTVRLAGQLMEATDSQGNIVLLEEG